MPGGTPSSNLNYCSLSQLEMQYDSKSGIVEMEYLMLWEGDHEQDG